MDTIQMLGSLGEFVGAIGVIVTLVYLAIQVRYSKEATQANTRSLEENRKVALAQTYQARSDNMQHVMLLAADSQPLCEITAACAWRRVSVDEWRAAFENLTPVEQQRWRYFQAAQYARMDNLVFQYEQGFITEEDYRDGTQGPLASYAVGWEVLGLVDERGRRARPSFRAELRKAVAVREERT